MHRMIQEELRKLARSPVGLRMAEAMNAPLEDFDDHGDGVDYATTLRRYFESVDKVLTPCVRLGFW